MACWIVSDPKLGRACFADSVTEVAFGPMFEDADAAEEFQEWLGHDPRRHSTDELCELKLNWMQSIEIGA